MLYKFFLLLAIFCSASQVAIAQQPYCQAAHIKTVDSSGLKLKYQVIKSDRQDLPTIIYLQGGPGGTIINEKTESKMKPYLSTVYVTDLRGTGCNSFDFEKIKSTVTSEQFVQDWIAIIKEEKLDEVVIIGGSYGTLLGTMLANEIERTHVSKVKAVILTGTVGKSGPPGQYRDGYLEQWHKSQQVPELTLDPSELKKDKPYGFTPEQFNRILLRSLLSGYFHSGQKVGHLFHVLKKLSDPEFAQRDGWRKWFESIGNKAPEEAPGLYEKIFCEEVDPIAGEYAYEWRDGEFRKLDVNECKDYEFIRPFDPAQYQVQAPMFYFEGALDGSTPNSGALVHFQSQKKSNKVMFKIAKGGHGTLDTLFMSCTPGVIETILQLGFEGTQNIIDRMKLCGRSEFEVLKGGN